MLPHCRRVAVLDRHFTLKLRLHNRDGHTYTSDYTKTEFFQKYAVELLDVGPVTFPAYTSATSEVKT